MLLNLSTEPIRTAMELWRSAYEHKTDGEAPPIEQQQQTLRMFMNVSRGWGDMMRSATPEAGKDDEFDDFFSEILSFHSWAKEELVRIEIGLEMEPPREHVDISSMKAKLEGGARVLESIPEFQLLNPDEQVIAELYAATRVSEAIERDKEIAACPPVPESPLISDTQRLVVDMSPWEKVSEEQLERLRLLDALQSLHSPLYWADKERLGIEQYLRKHTTSRVR